LLTHRELCYPWNVALQLPRRIAMTTPQSEAERAGRALAQAIHDHWLMFMLEGVALLLLGIAALAVPVLATLAISVLVGWLFLLTGVIGLVATIAMRHLPGFWWSLLSAVLGIVVGLILIGWPVSGAFSLTAVLIAFFLLEGIVSIMFALDHRREIG